MRRQVLLSVSVLLPSVSAFVVPVENSDGKRLRWPLPESSLSTVGLGRSLTYWVDPAICDSLRPRFLEYFQGWRTLASCEELHDTIARALTSWAANNRFVSFYNVSHLCAPLGDNDCASAEDRTAEIRFTARRGEPPAGQASAVASTTLVTSPDRPRATNGEVDEFGWSIQTASIEVTGAAVGGLMRTPQP